MLGRERIACWPPVSDRFHLAPLPSRRLPSTNCSARMSFEASRSRWVRGEVVGLAGLLARVAARRRERSSATSCDSEPCASQVNRISRFAARRHRARCGLLSEDRKRMASFPIGRCAKSDAGGDPAAVTIGRRLTATSERDGRSLRVGAAHQRSSRSARSRALGRQPTKVLLEVARSSSHPSSS